MQFCQKHWDALHEAIKARGVDHLGAQNSQELMREIVTSLEGRDDENEYDPLMDCHNMISTKAIEIVGLSLLDSTNGEQCPVCSVMDVMETDWIDGPAEAALNHCISLGLIGTNKHDKK